MNKFCFIDSSGILTKDSFLGTGLLVVRNVGDMADKLNKNSQPAKEKTKQNKNIQIEQMIVNGRKDEAIIILKNSKRFEMKFDHIGASAMPFYERMIDIFLSDSENRFSVMVVNKHNPKFDHNGIEDAWETYTKYAALLIVEEMKNSPEDKLCIIVDEITRPRSKPLSLEDTILSKVRNIVATEPSLDFDNIFGALSIESHSNFLMQLSDLLLGAVMYDYKKDSNLISEKMAIKKEVFVKKLRDSLAVETLAEEFSTNKPAFFRVFESS